MVRVNLTIPDKGARLSVPPGWSHRSDDKGYLLVTPDYIPGCRMSFSFRSMPEGMPALAFIHHNAQRERQTSASQGRIGISSMRRRGRMRRKARGHSAGRLVSTTMWWPSSPKSPMSMSPKRRSRSSSRTWRMSWSRLTASHSAKWSRTSPMHVTSLSRRP